MKRLRYVNFGRPLTEEEISIYAPSVMNETGKDEGLTDKYSFLPTIVLIRNMKELGWIPYGVEQRSVRSESSRDFTKHMVVFRNPDDTPTEEGLVPEIVLTNSHDGRNSFEFYAGVYHVVKDTSFIIGDKSIEAFRIKHQGYTLDEVKKVVTKVLRLIPHVYDKINQMTKISLDQNQKLVFAVEAVKKRWQDIKMKKISLEKLIKKHNEGDLFPVLQEKTGIDFADIIRPIREDERDSTLWNLFQIVQEKIVSGGIKYELRKKKVDEETGKPVIVIRKQTARALVNIDQKIEVKKSIWKVASDMVKSFRKRQKLVTA